MALTRAFVHARLDKYSAMCSKMYRKHCDVSSTYAEEEEQVKPVHIRSFRPVDTATTDQRSSAVRKLSTRETCLFEVSADNFRMCNPLSDRAV